MATEGLTVWTPNGDAMLSPLEEEDLPAPQGDESAEERARAVLGQEGVDGHARST